jgi:delta1-piperideine-2-carboxylate reductase
MTIRQASGAGREQSDGVVLSQAQLTDMVARALAAGGCSAAVAAPIARTIAAAECDGTPSHGLLRLAGFLDAVKSGWADGRAEPRLISESASMLVVDACNGFTHLALDRYGTDVRAIARDTGVAILLVRNAHHFAALWPDIEPYASDGMIALSCVNSRARMAAWGGGKPVFGTNACAFACPREPGQPPVVWDQSTSVMSQGDVVLAAQEGRILPSGVGVDALGRATTDPKAILDGGALAPYGGAKGASIAFMVEILAAALTGSEFSFEEAGKGTSPSKCGQFLMVIDPSRAGADVGSRADVLVRAIADSGCDRMPGSRRYARRARAALEGISISGKAYAVLRELGVADIDSR